MLNMKLLGSLSAVASLVGLLGCQSSDPAPAAPRTATPADPHGWIGTETVKTRFGDFEFKNGYPTPAAADALLDQLKFNRAIEVYLTQIPAVAIIESRRGIRDFGAKRSNQVVIWETAHGRRDARAHGEHRDGVRDGLPRSEGRRPDRHRGPAEDARGGDGHAAALPRGHRPARAGQGQGRQVPVPAAGVQGRGARRATSSSSRRPTASTTSCAASRWTGRPTRPSRS